MNMDMDMDMDINMGGLNILLPWLLLYIHVGTGIL
jgi:hypothetical protein